jgi:hypothetical protein
MGHPDGWNALAFTSVDEVKKRERGKTRQIQKTN